MRSDILHVDLDAFYASAELLRRPELRGRPLVVGGAGPRGVVLSCSYEARAKGVRNGMPAMRARRLCPESVFVPPDFETYGRLSGAFREILRSVTPLVEPLSLDEAFCDVTGAHRLLGDSQAIATSIRERVSGELGLTCSVGGGPTKLVAKLASRAAKPDGVLLVDDVDGFLHPLPIGDLWGVGAATAERCAKLGIRTVRDVLTVSRDLLRKELGESAGAALADLARGVDARRVEPSLEAKSVGAEETFDTDVSSDEVIHGELLRLGDRVASRLMRAGLTARTITVKIRLAGFQTFTRSKTIRRPTADTWTIYRSARDLYDAFPRGRRAVRLVGVSATGLVRGAAPEQLSLDGAPKFADAERAVEKVRGRFGDSAVRFARLLRDDE